MLFSCCVSGTCSGMCFSGIFGWVQSLRIVGRLSDELTGKCVIERRYVMRGLFMH